MTIISENIRQIKHALLNLKYSTSRPPNTGPATPAMLSAHTNSPLHRSMIYSLLLVFP